MPNRKVVTTAPSSSSTNVAQTVSTAQGCSHRGGPCGSDTLFEWSVIQRSCPAGQPASLVSVVCAHRARELAGQRPGLGQVIRLDVDGAVFVWPAVHDRRDLEVAVRR